MNTKTSVEFIQENLLEFLSNKNTFLTPNIPEKKLNNAVKEFKIENYKSIVALHDSTLLGAADEGILFTGEKLIFRSMLNKAYEIPYDVILKVEYSKEIKKGKIFDSTEEKVWVYVDDTDYYNEKMTLDDDIEYYIDITSAIAVGEKEKMADFINYLVENLDELELKEEDLLKAIEDMSGDFKKAYLKLVINSTYIDDKKIDQKELAEIFLLMNKIKLSQEDRLSIREYIFNIANNNEDFNKLFDTIKAEAASGQLKSYVISLAKDILNINYVVKKDFNDASTYLKNNFELFNLDENTIDFLIETIKNDYKLLHAEIDDDAFKKTMKDTAAKAAGIGVPLGAVYLSGSVVGLSAAGMTSGLATLGMGGVLGLSSMATGIGAVVLLGIGTYHAVKYFTSDKAVSKYKMREMMLHAIIKQNQDTISQVIGDINYLVVMLNDIIDKQNEANNEIANKDVKIKKLIHMISQFSASLNNINEKQNFTQNLANRQNCPKELDISKLKKLTSDATKSDYFEIVSSCYEKIQKDDKCIYQLKENLSNQKLESLQEILKTLGY